MLYMRSLILNFLRLEKESSKVCGRVIAETNTIE